MRVYLGGPFFTPEQANVIDNLQDMCDSLGIDTFNPKRDCMLGKDATPEQVMSSNIDALMSVNALIAVTDGRDPGTFFECGYAYAVSCPIVYVWLDSQGRKFNVMLQQSAFAVCLSYDELRTVLYNMQQGLSEPIKFEGDLE